MKTLPERIGGEVRRELGRFGPAGGLGEIVEAWPDAVGSGIAANAWPARVARDGTLHVATSSSAWAFELTQLSISVLERLRERLREGCPEALRFAVGPLPEQGPESEKASSRIVPKANAAQRAEGERIAAGIEDRELREAVARAAAASLAAAAGPSADRPVW
jgi:Dna[CI] antecedent DciA-like protein